MEAHECPGAKGHAQTLILVEAPSMPVSALDNLQQVDLMARLETGPRLFAKLLHDFKKVESDDHGSHGRRSEARPIIRGRLRRIVN